MRANHPENGSRGWEGRSGRNDRAGGDQTSPSPSKRRESRDQMPIDDFDTPTPEGCGILGSATTARCAWSYTVSPSVRRLAPPRSRMPRGTDLEERSRDLSPRIQADGLVLATRGSLGLRDPGPFVRLMFYEGAFLPQPATPSCQRAETIIPERHPSFKGVVHLRRRDDTPSSHP